MSQRLRKNLVGLFGNYCFAPDCKSALYDRTERKLKHLYSASQKEKFWDKEMAQCG